MKVTTLCYLIKDNQYLMLYKNKNVQDINYLKYLGVGGKLKLNETIESCLKREVYEETGFILKHYTYHGIVLFETTDAYHETMHLYTSTSFEGFIKPCDEGELKWVPIEQVAHLPMWAGDHIFLKLIQEKAPFFKLKLMYNQEHLIHYEFIT